MSRAARLCPSCGSPLTEIRTREGNYWACGACEGRLISVAMLRQRLDSSIVNWIWGNARNTMNNGPRACPLCRRPMAQIAASPRPGAPLLDSCRFCTFIWFDTREMEDVEGQGDLTREEKQQTEVFRPLPEPQNLRKIAPADAARDNALKWERLRHLKDDDDKKSPDEFWKYIPALLGMPVEISGHQIVNRPWATWSLAGILTCVYILSRGRLLEFARAWGFIPADMNRYGGLTTLSCFFLHAGLLHLIGNVYYLFTFGDNVEDRIGPWRFLVVTFSGAVAGSLMHGMFAYGSENLPLVGASTGVSALLIFYMIHFPRVRLGILLRFFFRFYWLRMPAWVYILFWAAMQYALMYAQIEGMTNVSALGHLGGALTGLAFGLYYHFRPLSEKAPFSA
ncbi:MAG TPA: rhomboid family intramembrane serine protease [Candidatus Sumerlaeota bacterium]|nr:rhomboid family intramembrane serine protease [Candidatus Sumerlaeota bacterium]